MPSTAAFYSENEVKKPPEKRVHHNNSKCPSGNDIPKHERKPGTGFDDRKIRQEMTRLAPTG